LENLWKTVGIPSVWPRKGWSIPILELTIQNTQVQVSHWLVKPN
jgi:hypothetical protein